MYLRRLHNCPMDMNWLLAPLIAKRALPNVVYGEKRAITLAEHLKVIDREKNPGRQVFYEVCWNVGGLQSDIGKWGLRLFSFVVLFDSIHRIITATLFGARTACCCPW
jgi:hypothetical protein